MFVFNLLLTELTLNRLESMLTTSHIPENWRKIFMQKIDYYEVLQLIKNNGKDGILQSNLWKKIGATSREGSRIALKLLKQGLITRKRVLHNGKWTYKLVSNKLPIQIDSMMDIPCTFCMEQERCGEKKYITPEKCEKLTNYLLKIIKKEDN